MNILKIADSKFEIADLFIPSAAWKGGAIVPRIAFSLTQNQMRHCFDSSAGFTLPNGAVRAPDAAWVLREKWDALTKEERMKFAPVVPNFVIEIRSQSETLRQQKSKMEEYLAAGVQLGWLIDPFDRKVHIYRQSEQPKVLEDPASVSGDPELPGFVLDLTQVW